MTALVKINEEGRRIGQDHPRAVLTDHEVDLLLGLLAEREQLIRRLVMTGTRQKEIDNQLTLHNLSYRCLAEKFDIHRRTVGKIANGERRCQTGVLKACP